MVVNADNNMAASNPQPIAQPSHRGAPVTNDVQQAVSPPSKQALQSWWKKFSRKPEKDGERVTAPAGIFGVPLAESIRYANVAISLTNEQGESFIYGYVPIVVAKCGVFLKEKATDVEGIYRLNGSAKRIKDLQTTFNTPDRYGKGLDWTGYTVHDAANVLRRYLNQLPEPIVPLEFYERFRDPLRAYQANSGDPADTQAMEYAEHAKAVAAYQRLITELPPLNRQLLLYLLDLLAVFASKSDLNRMTAQNLAAIFQPGIISHPAHDMAPQEYRLSQDVLIFLIENQDNFLIGMTGTGIDDKTRDEVASGVPAAKTTPKSTIGRSASNASAGADSLRRLRRNVSVGSHGSRTRASPDVSTPGTPSSPSATGQSGNASGLSRSNTVPSKRSPGLAGQRFNRASESSQPSTPVVNAPPTIPGSPPDQQPKAEDASQAPTNDIVVVVAAASAAPQEVPNSQGSATVNLDTVSDPAANLPVPAQRDPGADRNLGNPDEAKTGNRERKISNLLTGKSPIFGPSDVQSGQRPPRKLQKRRLPGSANDSAQSSQASLHADETNNFHTPLLTPNANTLDQADPLESVPRTVVATNVSPDAVRNATTLTPPSAKIQQPQQRGLMPPHSPTLSIHSRGSATDPSDLDALEDPAVREERKRHRLGLSSARAEEGPLQPPPLIGQNVAAGASNSSIGSNRPRKSFTGDSQATQHADSITTSQPSVAGMSSRESTDPWKESQPEPEKKGLFGKWKAKIQQSKEEKREREAEKERAKSPPRFQTEQSGSRHSLSAIAHEHFSPRGRSFDQSRAETLPVVTERLMNEGQQQRRPQSMQPGPAIFPVQGYPTAPHGRLSEPTTHAQPSIVVHPQAPNQTPVQPNTATQVPPEVAILPQQHASNPTQAAPTSIQPQSAIDPVENAATVPIISESDQDAIQAPRREQTQ